MLSFKKTYIDSRWSTSDSVDASNFKVELPQTMLCPENTVFFISDICIPHVWTTVEPGYNDKLYITTLNVTTYTSYVLTLSSGNYIPSTFATELQNQLRTLLGTFTVTVDINNGVVVNAGTSNAAYAFKILTDDDLVSGQYWYGASYNKYDLTSANDLINNRVSSNGFIGASSSWKSGFLNLNWINNIYISSPNLGSFDTVFAGKGDNNIIKKTPITVNYGYMNVDQVTVPNDYLDCSKQCLQTLEFHLKTSKGKYVPLHGANVSFSIIFNKFSIEL